MNNQMWKWEWWFAWYPVKIETEDEVKWVWGKWIKRRNIWVIKDGDVVKAKIKKEYNDI